MKPLLSYRTRSQIRKIAWVTLAWIFVSILQFFLGYGMLQYYKCDLTGVNPLDFFLGSILIGLLAGCLGGSMVVVVWEKWLRQKTYGVMLLSMFFSYTVTYILVSGMGGIFIHSVEYNLPIYHVNVVGETLRQLTSLNQVISYVFWLIIVLATMIVFQVNDKYGPGIFGDFLLGKYFHPRREERIFMFLDMRSSTTIAEQLGEKKYFDLVRELFSDATAPILYSKGEIYQYVGDEIIVSWRMERGIESANCLRCFFEIRKTFAHKASEYRRKYGVMPEFKAGLHYGYVMAGEVGVVKRDISYSGDVLNTTSRIQSKCNELGVDILFSKFLFDKLVFQSQMLEPKKVGEMLLRGKHETVVLYTVQHSGFSSI